MTDRMATAEELATELRYARQAELDAQRRYAEAVAYRVRMGINFDLALEREEGKR